MASKRRSTGAGDIGVNLTPMIDCVFQLIIFFIISTRFTALSPLQVHKPLQSQAIYAPEVMDAPNRLIVNVVSVMPPDPQSPDPVRAAEAKHYEVLGSHYEIGRQQELIDRIRRARRRALDAGYEEFFVEIRGDRRVKFTYIEPVMTAAAKAGVGKMNITARVEG